MSEETTLTMYAMGETQVQLFAAISDSDWPHYLGAFAEFALPGQSTAMWRQADADWYRTGDSLESLRDRDYLIHESTVDGLDDTDPQAFPGLQHRLEQVALARRIAVDAHAGQVDKNGDPYIEHPARVAVRVDHLVGQAVAWLHDVVEDTGVSADDLLAAGVDTEVIAAVLLLMRRAEVPDDHYYRRIAEHAIAREVKLADIADNTDPARTARLDPEMRDRLAHKYEHARRALGALEEQA